MIEYLKIEGFKSIKKAEIDFRPVNVLIGSNGAGKSNLITFFRLLRAMFKKQLQAYVMEQKADNLLYFGRKYTENISGKIIFTDEDNNKAYLFSLGSSVDSDMFIEYEGSGFDVEKGDDKKHYVYKNHLRESEIGQTKDPREKGLNDYMLGIQIYHFHDTSSTSWLRKPCSVEDNLQLRPDGRNLPAFLYMLKENHPKVYARMLKNIQSVAPFIYDFILNPSITKGREGEIELRWIEKGDLESNFSAHHFSDGTLRFIALTAVLLQPNPPSLIIIDEPELGLHPFAISKLAGMIRIASVKSQILVSTQSATFVDQFKLEEIITVDRSAQEKQSVFRRLNPKDWEHWLEDYTTGDLWERNIFNSAQPFDK